MSAVVLVKICADLGRDGEAGRDRQTDPRHLMEICALATEERLHLASAVRVTIPEIIDVARGFLFRQRCASGSFPFPGHKDFERLRGSAH